MTCLTGNKETSLTADLWAALGHLMLDFNEAEKRGVQIGDEIFGLAAETQRMVQQMDKNFASVDPADLKPTQKTELAGLLDELKEMINDLSERTKKLRPSRGRRLSQREHQRLARGLKSASAAIHIH